MYYAVLFIVLLDCKYCMFCVDLDKKALSLLKTFAHLDLKTFDGKDVLLLCPLIANS